MIGTFRKLISQSTLLITVLFVCSNNSLADEKAKPELQTGASTQMLAYTCTGCHGAKGVSAGPSIPTLSGLSAAYFVDIMEQFQSDKTPSTIMGRIAKGYSEDEILQLAEYFSSQTFVAAKGQASDETMAEKGEQLHDKYCERCHTEYGTLGGDDSGFLKGQWKYYLKSQLMDFHSGARKAPRKMTKQIKRMYRKEGDAGFEALVEFYSQQADQK